jgi:hypothetical protein
MTQAELLVVVSKSDSVLFHIVVEPFIPDMTLFQEYDSKIKIEHVEEEHFHKLRQNEELF